MFFFFGEFRMRRVIFQAATWSCVWLLSAMAAVSVEYVKYRDPNQPVSVRVKDLMSRMTLEEKIGQMTQIDRMVASPEIMRTYSIGMFL